MSDTDRQLLLAIEKERDRYKAALEKIAGNCECMDASKCPSCVAETALNGRGT